MTHVHEIESGRLLLRQWQESDFPAFAVMCAGAETMRYFPSILTNEESRQSAERYRELISLLRMWA